MDDLGIEYQTVLGFPPVDFVHLAADLGCRYISMKARGGGGPYNPFDHPPFSFLDDLSLRRRMIAAMSQRGVSISLGEGFVVQPGTDLLDDRASLDLMSEFGVTRANAVTMDPDLNRSFDQFAAFRESARTRPGLGFGARVRHADGYSIALGCAQWWHRVRISLTMPRVG